MQALFIAELITKTKQNYYNNSVNNAHHSYPAKWFKFSVCALSGCCSTIGGSSHFESVLTADELLKAFSYQWKDCEPSSQHNCDRE